MIQPYRARLFATMDHDKMIATADITFNIVTTAPGFDGTFSLRHVTAAAEMIGEALASREVPVVRGNAQNDRRAPSACAGNFTPGRNAVDFVLC